MVFRLSRWGDSAFPYSPSRILTIALFCSTDIIIEAQDPSPARVDDDEPNPAAKVPEVSKHPQATTVAHNRPAADLSYTVVVGLGKTQLLGTQSHLLNLKLQS